MLSMIAIVIGHQLFSASASKFAVLRLAIKGLNAKTEEFENRKIRFHLNVIGFGFGYRLQLHEIQSIFSVTAQS